MACPTPGTPAAHAFGGETFKWSVLSSGFFIEAVKPFAIDQPWLNPVDAVVARHLAPMMVVSQSLSLDARRILKAVGVDLGRQSTLGVAGRISPFHFIGRSCDRSNNAHVLADA